MFQFFRSEVKKMLGSKYLIFGFIVSFIGLSIDFVSNLNIYFCGMDIYIPVFEKWIGIVADDIGALIFYWLLPLSVSIPFAWTMRDEMNSGYISQVVTRVKKRYYFLTKFVVSFFSGAIIAVGSFAIQFFAHSFFLKALYPQPNDMRTAIIPRAFLSELYYTNPYLYLLIWTLVVSLWCGVISGLCMTISFFIRKRILVVISTQIIFIFQNIWVSGSITRYNKYPAWFNYVCVTGTNFNTSIVFKTIAILLLIEIIVTAVMGKLYENV